MENIVQFLLLSLCFKKLSAAEASESVYMRERVKTVLMEAKVITTGDHDSCCYRFHNYDGIES